MGTVIYIPAYNAEKTILKVLDRIPESLKKSVEEIIVVDNNSTDQTSSVVQRYREEKNLTKLTLIRNSENRGYGGSQKIAYRYCLKKKYDYVAMLHGDAQYAPELLESLINPLIASGYAMIFGSRIRGNPLKGGMPLIRYLGNRFLTTMQNFFLKMKLSEFHSGYRVFSLKAIDKVPFERLSSDYHFDTEIIIILKHFGFQIGEAPIPTHYGDEENYVNIWKYGIDVLVTTLTYFLHRTGIRKSKNWQRILVGESANTVLHVESRELP